MFRYVDIVLLLTAVYIAAPLIIALIKEIINESQDRKTGP